MRGFEWRYLWQQCQSDEVRSLQGMYRSSVAFSPEGRYLALSGDEDVIVRDAVSGLEIKKLPGSATSVTFSPSDDYLVTAGDQVKVWNTRTWDTVRTLPEDLSPAVFSPDGRWLVTLAETRDGYRVRNTETWEQEGSCPLDLVDPALPWSGRHALTFSADGRLLLTPGRAKDVENAFQVWEFPSLKPLNHFSGSPAISSAAFLPDGKRLLTGDWGGNLNIWDIVDGNIIETLDAHKSEVSVIVSAPDGRAFTTASQDTSIVIWDASTLQPRKCLLGHIGGIYGLAMSPNEELLASVDGVGVIRFWDASDDSTYPETEGTDLVLGFTEDSRSLIAVNPRGAVIWDIVANETSEIAIPTVERLWLGRIPGDNAIPLALQASKMLLSIGSSEGELELWDLLNGKQVMALSAFDGGTVTATALSSDGRHVAAATESGSVTILDISTRRRISQFNVEKIALWCLTFSPDNRYLAISGRNNHHVWLWDIVAQRMAHELEKPAGFIPSVAFSPDGNLLAAARLQERAASLWEIPSGRFEALLLGHSSFGAGVAFTPDGRSLAVGCDNGQVKLWSLETMQEVALLTFEGGFSSMAFSPDGRNLAVGYQALEQPRIRLFKAPSFEEIENAEKVASDKVR